MHPDSTTSRTDNFKTPVLAIVTHMKSPHGADFIRLILFGYYPNGGDPNLDIRYSTDLNLDGPPDEMRHPELETILRETLAIHRLWDRWAQQGRGLMLGFNCWREFAGQQFSPITLELVGNDGVTARVNGNQKNAESHPALYMSLRDLIREDGKWTT